MGSAGGAQSGSEGRECEGEGSVAAQQATGRECEGEGSVAAQQATGLEGAAEGREGVGGHERASSIRRTCSM